MRTTPVLAGISVYSILSALALAALAPSSASAADMKRRGGQVEGTFGASLCIPGKGDCKSADDVSGKTGPSFGMGFLIGFRPIKYLLIGGAYNLGFFNPDYKDGAADVYKSAYQNSVFGVVRAIIPIWRVDIGLELAPGWSRQTFKVREGLASAFLGDKVYSQGFALKTAPVVDIFITRQFFVGAKVDFIFNFHKQVCSASGSTSGCTTADDNKQASVHQTLVGVHLGGTF